MGRMRPSRHARRIWALCLWLLPTVVAWPQETLYVTDVVQLGMHRAEDASDEPFRSLVSGASVTVLESAGDHARVRTADGEEGWVRSSELTADPPARARLAGLEARVAELDVTVDAIERENRAYQERFERYRGMLPWPWVLGAVLVALAAGFLGGYWWLDAAIRRRYGGFKVY